MHKHGRSTKDAKKWDEFKQGLPAKFCDDLMYRYSQFRQADKDKDGKMTVEELKSLFEKMEGTTDTDIETLLAAADVDVLDHPIHDQLVYLRKDDQRSVGEGVKGGEPPRPPDTPRGIGI